MTRQTGGQAVVETLVALGVERVFGIVSVHNLPIADAILRDGRITWHPVRHEQAAVHAADGCARATGRLGVAITSTGPGAANAMGGLFEAGYASSPVLMITGQVESAFIGRGVGFLHEADRQADMLRSVCRSVQTVRSRAELADVVAFVATDILCGRPQPGAVEIPIDLQQAEHDDGPVNVVTIPPVAPPAATIEAAAALLREATRVLIVAGGGVITAGAGSELTALAELLGAPVITSIEGRGSIAEDHRLALGPNSDLTVMDPLFATADVVLAVGTRFQQATPVQRALTLPGRLIHLDADSTVFGKVHRPSLTLAGDARLGLTALIDSLGSGARSSDDDYLALATNARAKAKADARANMGADFEQVMESIRAHLPDDGIVVKDATISSYIWANRCLPVLQPRTSMRATSMAIGPALPLGIGAAAGTGRSTVVVHGDGGIMLTIGELATAVQLGVPLVVCVFNDGGYGILRYMQNAAYGGRLIGVDLVTPDFAVLARSVGMDSVNVSNAVAFDAAFATAIESRRPWLLDIDITGFEPMQIRPQQPAVR
jgi:acetolactate synthase-1/2/3 large subunit